jgi:hypothetical protein
MCTTVGEIERAVAAFAQSPNGGLIVTGERVGKRSSRTDHFAHRSVSSMSIWYTGDLSDDYGLPPWRRDRRIASMGSGRARARRTA